jgi:type I restriction enzyme S subunit
VNQHVLIIRPTEVLLPEFLRHFLASPSVQGRIWREEYGVTRQALTKGWVQALQVPLAPIAEQHRIIAKVDALMSRARAARARLDKVPLLLKQFRQSVLSKAFSGELTESWREARGLSADWPEVSIEDVGSVGTGSTPLRANAGYFAGAGTPWVTSAATGSPFVMEAQEFVTPAAIAEHRLKLYPVGTLLVAMYGEGKTRGQVTELLIEATINQACAAIVVDESLAVRDFVKLLLEGSYFQMRERAEGGNQPNLNLSKIRQFPLRLPSVEEQRQIVAVARRLLSRADSLDKLLERARQALDRAPQTILEKAFAGDLVPTEADLAAAEGRGFEPAEEALTRVMVHRLSAGNAGKGRVANAPQRGRLKSAERSTR